MKIDLIAFLSCVLLVSAGCTTSSGGLSNKYLYKYEAPKKNDLISSVDLENHEPAPDQFAVYINSACYIFKDFDLNIEINGHLTIRKQFAVLHSHSYKAFKLKLPDGTYHLKVWSNKLNVEFSEKVRVQNYRFAIIELDRNEVDKKTNIRFSPLPKGKIMYVL
jgi:hypothetical protein